ncbi:unnamed protein product, partial [marine sediment metagenome]
LQLHRFHYGRGTIQAGGVMIGGGKLFKLKMINNKDDKKT